MITVQGTLRTADGLAWQGSLPVARISGPMFQGGSLTLTNKVFFTSGPEGAFSTLMFAGEYWVHSEPLANRESPQKKFKIRVPNSVDGDFGATVTLEEVIVAGLALPEYFGGLPESEGGGGGGSGVDFSGVWYSGADALRARTIHTDGQLAFLRYFEASGDGGVGWFGYNATSEDEDTGEDPDTIKPDNVDSGSPGRWKRLT